MKPLFFNLIFGIVLISLLSGCYCFLEGAHNNVRSLRGFKEGLICEGNGGPTYGIQINPYYGFPNKDLELVKKEQTSEKTHNNAGDFQFNSFGQVGLRVEKYVTPFNIIPYKILGLGLDYSYSNVNVRYNEYSQFVYKNENIFTKNRMVASVNLMTLVTGRIIGYTTLQAGCVLAKNKFMNQNPAFNTTYEKESPKFNYRIGYGFQYYFAHGIGLVAEGGYGSGVFAKTGFCIWF